MAFFVPMRIHWPVFLLLAVLTACGGHVFGPGDEEAIRQVMADQETAWDRGDIPGFMEGYAPDVCFVSDRGTTCGREQVTANYQRRYPNKDAMGDLEFSVGEVIAAGGDHAWCTGGWKLHRESDTLSGGFSLLWQRQGDAWRIIRDHTH